MSNQHSATAKSTGNYIHAALCLAMLLAGSGCEDHVYSDYGRRRGYAETSLNGTRVLSDMFATAGHRVRSWSYLSPGLSGADVIVWFPDDFEPPTSEVETWLTYWLTSGDPNEPPRVLIFVGRDFDAAPDYWQRMQSQAPPKLKKEYARRLTESQNDAAGRQKLKLDRSETDGWFKLDNSASNAKVKGLSGPWAAGIDATRIDIERNTRLTPLNSNHTTWLADENDEPLVSEFQYSNYNAAGRLIMIENGSWLLNAPMVNHEHRALAGRLIDSVGPPKRTVVFLESQEGGPPVRDTDPNAEPPTGLQLFRVWPIGAVLTQLAALGIVAALMKWPIFGTPRHLKRDSITDFGSHVAALGRLLRYGRNRLYAIELLRTYRQSIRHDGSPTTEISVPTTSLPDSTSNTTAPE